MLNVILSKDPIGGEEYEGDGEEHSYAAGGCHDSCSTKNLILAAQRI